MCLTDVFFRFCFSLGFGCFFFLFLRTGEELESDSEEKESELELELLSEESELGSRFLFPCLVPSLDFRVLPCLEDLLFFLALSLEPLLLELLLLLLLLDREAEERDLF